MLPMNFLTPEKTAHFVMTGAWSEKALAETKLFGNTSVTATSEADNYSFIPEVDLSDVKTVRIYISRPTIRFSAHSGRNSRIPQFRS